MDPANRMNGKPNLDALRGGVNLECNILKNRVGEIFAARMREPFDRVPVVGEIVQITHRGDIKKVDVDVVRGSLENKRWEIIKTLRSLGIDESEGEWACEEHSVGMTQDGNPTVRFLLTWTQRDVAEKPTLTVVP